LNKSFYVKDTAQKAKYYRTSEPVLIELIEGQEDRWLSQQCIKLGVGEWTAYNINSRKSQTCKPAVRAKAESVPAAFTFSLNGQAEDINMTETDWVDVKLDKTNFLQGINTLKLAVGSGTVYFDWFNFE
jgi:hypothetical protein